MEPPRKHPYNPRWKPIVIFLAATALFHLLCVFEATHPHPSLFTALLGTRGQACFAWAMVAVSCAALVTAGVAACRRIGKQYFLELGDEAIVLPQGLLRIRDVRLPYTAIERAWEGKLFEKPLLFLKSGGKEFMIASQRLPDKASFAEVREFIYSRVKLRREKSGPGLG